MIRADRLRLVESPLGDTLCGASVRPAKHRKALVFRRRTNEDRAGADRVGANPGPAREVDRPAVSPPAIPASAAPARKDDRPMALIPSKPAAPSAAAPSPMAPPAAGTAFRPAAAEPPRPATRPADRRTLVVGRGISLAGTITDSERLVVEGTVEASLHNGSELSIAIGGTFKGEIEIDEADVSGTFDGAIVARTALVVRSTGRVLGNVRCRKLTVEEGGQISGRIEMISDQQGASLASMPARPGPGVAPMPDAMPLRAEMQAAG
jgi:cytoskeletal protein CcmA (bactofilin family)